MAGAGIGFVDRGTHSLTAARGSWRLLATRSGEELGQAAPAEAATVFRREGDFWTVAYGGKVVRMRDAKGLAYLARLLRHPYHEFHVLDLLAGNGPRETAPAGTVAQASDSGPVLDEQAKRAYRERIAELEAEIDQADHWNDRERSARAHHELDALTHELAAALGLGGRDRRAGSESERARASVTKALRSAMRRLDAAHPELGRHLSLAVHTGTFCRYEPDPRAPVAWES